MAKRMLISGALCAILGGSLTAQTAPTVAPQPNRITPQPLRLSGCLQRWDPSTMGPPPMATRAGGEATAADATFVLTNAEPATREATTPPPAPASQIPAAGKGLALGGHASYLLTPARTDLDFSAHVDRQVEITGTLVADEDAATPAARPSTPAPAPSPTAPRPGDTPRAPAPPVALTVASLEVVGQTCRTK